MVITGISSLKEQESNFYIFVFSFKQLTGKGNVFQSSVTCMG